MACHGVLARGSIVVMILFLVILGIWFRFYHLDRKVYANDEVFTSLRIAGYTRAELKAERRALDSAGWHRYQRVVPERGLRETMAALIDDVHPPGYFLVARAWAQWFGSSVWVVRSLSAVFGLLVFPSLYWLCRELGESRAVGWIAIALLAVSPFHVVYAQEARQYSLWTVTILASSAALLLALRVKSIAGWALYSLTVTLGLYTHYLAGVVVIGHGLYVVATEGLRARRSLVAFVLAATASLLAFAPWLAVTVRMGGAAYTRWRIPPLVWGQRWVMNLSSIFFDPQVGRSDMLFEVFAGDDARLRFDEVSTYVILLVALLVCYSVYVLYREASRRVWLFVSVLIWPLVLFMAVPDVVSGGQRSTIGRYLIPAYVGIQLAMAHCLAVRTGRAVEPWRRRRWQGVTVALAGLGILSCAVSSQADTWWDSYGSYNDPKVARAINRGVSPLIVVGAPIPLLALSHLVHPGVTLQLAEDTFEPPMRAFSDVFVYYPSRGFLDGIRRNGGYQLRPVYERLNLWRLESTGQTSEGKG